MRPLTGDHTWHGRQRPADHDPASLMASTSSSHMSFFLADESSVDSYLEQSNNPHGRFLDARKAAAPTSVPPPRGNDKDNEYPRQTTMQRDRDYIPPHSQSSRASVFTHSPASMRSQNCPSPSRPITPIMLGTSYTGSVISTPSSRRNSFAGSLSDHEISSDEEFFEQRPPDVLDSGSAPQLVMPSIKMPSRRPFTETGKNLGRLKVLFAGDSGVGKTSMVKAIVQTCEHIVHVDSIPSQAESNTRRRHESIPRKVSHSTSSISEIYASTKPYPEWWSMLDEPHNSQRRKSLGDSVLERNVCFVDTPGYRNGSSAMETIMSCVEYIEEHLNKISSDSLSDSDMLNMLGGNGGFQVDVVFYFVSQKMKPVDIEYIRRLTPLTNVIPLLAQADSLSPNQLAMYKEQLAGQLREAGLQPFSFSLASHNRFAETVPSIPYAVSSATGSDDDIMDASLLMSADYVQPLMTSELEYLVKNVFSPSGISWLRHTAAKKYLEWRSSTPSRPRHLYRPLSPPGPMPASVLSRSPENPISPRTSLVLARLVNPQLAYDPPQLRVADWAADLQRSLASERAQYESLARGERAVWLTERLNECVQDGTLIALNKPRGMSAVGVKGPLKHEISTKTALHQDPLGLLQIAADLRVKGWVALEFIGSLGVIGALAFWVSRQHWHTDPLELALADEWARRWAAMSI